MSKKIYLCDFNDSFTFNIFSTLKTIDQHLDIEVIPFKRMLSFFQVLDNEERACAVILGPGPGHPDEYSKLFSSIRKLMDKPNIFLLGICLGHQIIWRIQNYNITHCRRPEHGQVVHYQLPVKLSKKLELNQQIDVQRYNSLSVKINDSQIKQLSEAGWGLFCFEGELIIAEHENILSYQFHPESIGTCCPESFFSPLLKFLL